MKGQKTHGGQRPGSGRPSKLNTGKSLTIRLDKDNEEYMESIDNKSRYINDLIRREREGK
ncbi:MAG: hypothetical protein RR382_01845 [Tannerellaceae bacterium]